MTKMRIMRRGLIAVLAAGALAPATASATHNGTCDGFEDPACNVRYFNDHTAGPVIDKLDPYVYFIYDTRRFATEVAQLVLCKYFGAC